jgi:xylan 1,4-beta-xylosidase
MDGWCDPAVADSCKRTCFGSHNLSVSLYLPFYQAIASAVVAVDSKLRVGGPASSDCWGGTTFGHCCGGKPYPALDQIPGHNWARDLVDWSATSQQPSLVSFVSSHAYSGPCGNATALYLALKKFHDAIRLSKRPDTPSIVTEWPSSGIPMGAECDGISNYHDTSAQASFAARTIYLMGSMFQGAFSYWAFSDVFEEQGWSWDVFNGGFGLINRFGVRKPVFNAFKMLHDAGKERWVVNASDAAHTAPVMLFAGKWSGRVAQI